jgi:hypothetical protein
LYLYLNGIRKERKERKEENVFGFSLNWRL